MQWRRKQGAMSIDWKELTMKLTRGEKSIVLRGDLKLKQLNWSDNHLSSPIPASLQSFSSSSFEGNSLLRGSPLKNCSLGVPPPSPSPTSSTSSKEKSEKRINIGAIVAIALGGSAVLFLLVLMIVVYCMKKKDGEGSAAAGKGKGKRSEQPKEDFVSGVQEPEKNRPVFCEGYSYNFDLEDLLRASAEVLGKRSYGTTYEAILEEGTNVVVKRLKVVVAGKKEFDQQMEIVRRMADQGFLVEASCSKSLCSLWNWGLDDLQNRHHIQTKPPILTESFEWVVEPEEALDTSWNGKEMAWECLMRWKNQPDFEATWECASRLRKPFPDFHLEDKVVVKGGYC